MVIVWYGIVHVLWDELGGLLLQIINDWILILCTHNVTLILIMAMHSSHYLIHTVCMMLMLLLLLLYLLLFVLKLWLIIFQYHGRFQSFL